MKENMIDESKILSLREILSKAATECPDKWAYRYKRNNSVVNVTFKQFYNDTLSLGAYLTERGYSDTHIAIVGENSYEWITVFLTVLNTSGVFVPLDKELPTDDLIGLINESDSTLIFCDKKHETELAGRLGEIPGIKEIITFERETTEGNLISYAEAMKEGAALDKSRYLNLEIDENALKYLVYTSGTTGIAKGVMLSMRNIRYTIHYGVKLQKMLDCGLSVLPYHHTYEAVCDLLAALHEHTTICINDSYKNVSQNLKLFKPDYLYIVPMFAEFFKKAILKEAERKGSLKKLLRGIKISNFLRKIGIDLRGVFFKEIKQSFGGNLTKINCGGAPISPETVDFFIDIGFKFHTGYGITECCPIVAGNKDGCLTNDTVGGIMQCMQVKIDNPNENGEGEIILKGDNVMMGYYKRPDLTAEVLSDGWFSTGDYGAITKQGFLKITGRKKNLIVLNNGKNIYPEELENRISQIEYITEVIVRGVKDGETGEVGLLAEVYCENPKSEEEILSDIRKVQSKNPYYKRISEVKLRTEPFPKTTTKKIKR